MKEILSNHQMATQIMEKVAGQGDDLPSEYRWAKSFIEEYKEMVTSFRDAMTPEQGQDITEHPGQDWHPQLEEDLQG